MNLHLQSVFPAVLLAASLIPASAQLAPHSAPMVVIHGKPYVQVFINGKGPFRFMIDTGTSAEAIVTPGLADELHLPAKSTIVLHDPTGVPGPTVPVRLIDTLTIAGVDFYAIHAAEHTLLTNDVPCDGLLGFRLFDGTLLTLDYPAGRIILKDGELQPDGGNSVQPFYTHDGLPFITLNVGDLQIETLVDSGGAGFAIPDRDARQMGIGADADLMGTERTLAAIFPYRVAQLSSDVRFGAATFQKPWIEINSAFQYANLGSEALQHFSVTFDQDNDLLRFDGPRKSVSLGIAPTPISTSGTSFNLAAPAGVTPVQ